MKRTLHIFRNQQAALDQLNKDLNKYRKVRFLGGVGIETNGDEHWYMASYAIEHRLPGVPRTCLSA